MQTVPSLAQLGAFAGMQNLKFSLLTGASGVWVPAKRQALVILTGPGGIGASATRSGCAGGTSIKLIDCGLIESANYLVGQQNSGDPSSLVLPANALIPAGLTISATAGTNTAPGAGSNGDLNFNGGIGMPVPIAGAKLQRTDPSGTPVDISLQIDLFSGVTASSHGGTVTTGSVATTAGSAPGGASLWGGCDSLSGNASVYGAGGGATAANGYQGGPGCIAIWEW